MFDDTILFVMFQGGATSEFAWNDGPSKFLNKLKKVGKIYTYQNKIYNVFYYDLSDKERKDFDDDIDFDINYINIDYHINMVFNDIKHKYDLNKIKLIPIGWSIGCYFCMAFSQKYHKFCKFQILLDSVWCVPECNINFINFLTKKLSYIKFDNTDLKLLQKKIITKNNIKDMRKLYEISMLLWAIDVFKKKFFKFKILTLSFFDLDSVETKHSFNKCKLKEVAFLTKQNKDYKNIFCIDKTHQLFSDNDTAIDIINNIKLLL
jgi:hypothetical protein